MNSSYIKSVKKERGKITYELIDNDLSAEELMNVPEIRKILNETDLWWFNEDYEGKVSSFWIAVYDCGVSEPVSVTY